MHRSERWWFASLSPASRAWWALLRECIAHIPTVICCSTTWHRPVLCVRVLYGETLRDPIERCTHKHSEGWCQVMLEQMIMGLCAIWAWRIAHLQTELIILWSSPVRWAHSWFHGGYFGTNKASFMIGHSTYDDRQEPDAKVEDRGKRYIVLLHPASEATRHTARTRLPVKQSWVQIWNTLPTRLE